MDMISIIDIIDIDGPIISYCSGAKHIGKLWSMERYETGLVFDFCKLNEGIPNHVLHGHDKHTFKVIERYRPVYLVESVYGDMVQVGM